MIQYREILELNFREVSQRTIATSVGNSRQIVSDVIQKSKELCLNELSDDMLTTINIQYYTDLRDCLVKTLME